MQETKKKLTTIDIHTGSDLFADADPVGLLPAVSASEFQRKLYERLDGLFPNANIFIRWGPNLPEEPDVLTIPHSPKAEAKVERLVEAVRDEAEGWLCYDDAIREAFA